MNANPRDPIGRTAPWHHRQTGFGFIVFLTLLFIGANVLAWWMGC